MKIREGSPLWRRALRAATLRVFHGVENNGDARFDHNGESWFLDQVFDAWRREPRVRILFDVGANIGDYTARVLARAEVAGQSISLQLFEPSGTCVEVLRSRFAGKPGIVVNDAAVGESAGRLRLRAPEAGSPLASLIRRPGQMDSEGEEVRVLRLEDFASEAGLTHIDLLKLDVEGAELAALRGLGAWLDPARVAMIQFEYGGTTLDAGTTLREITALLESRGYRLAKLFPRSLEVRRYKSWMEHFNYANFVALDARTVGCG